MLKEVKYKVLIISSNEKISTTLCKLLPPNKYVVESISNSIPSAERLLLERNYDIVIINSPVGDNDAVELSIEIVERYKCGTILLVNSYSYDEVYDKTLESGVITLSKPTSKELFIQSLHLISSSKEKFTSYSSSTSPSLKSKMEEIKIINKAKFLLISKNKLNEEEAHKYIEKTAMNNRISKKEVALTVISELSSKGEK